MDRRTLLKSLTIIPFTKNKKSSNLEEDIYYFNKITKDNYKIKIKEGPLMGPDNPYLWLNIINNINEYQFKYAEFFLGQRSNKVQLENLTQNCIGLFPINNKNIYFNYNDKEYNGKYLLFGNPKIFSQTKTRLGTITSKGSIELIIGNNNIKIKEIESNSPNDLSRIYKQIIKDL